jgi:hypothetical protein
MATSLPKDDRLNAVEHRVAADDTACRDAALRQINARTRSTYTEQSRRQKARGAPPNRCIGRAIVRVT